MSHDTEKDIQLVKKVRRESDPCLALIRESKWGDQLFLIWEREKGYQVSVAAWKTT